MARMTRRHKPRSGSPRPRAANGHRGPRDAFRGPGPHHRRPTQPEIVRPQTRCHLAEHDLRPSGRPRGHGARSSPITPKDILQVPATTRSPCPTSTAPRPCATRGRRTRSRKATTPFLPFGPTHLGRAARRCPDRSRPSGHRGLRNPAPTMLRLSRLALDPDGHEYQDTCGTASVQADSL